MNKAPKGYLIEKGDILINTSVYGPSRHVINCVNGNYAFFGAGGHCLDIQKRKNKLERVWAGIFKEGDATYELYTTKEFITTWYRVKINNEYEEVFIEKLTIRGEMPRHLILDNGVLVYKETSLAKCFQELEPAVAHARILFQGIIKDKIERFEKHLSLFR